MLLQCWRRLRKAQTSRSPRGPAGRRAAPSRPQLFVEPLEDRVTPTLIFSNNFGTERSISAGGGVLSSPPIYLIFWGSYWGSATSANALAVTAAAQNVINSAYFTAVKQYGSGGVPTFGGVAYDSSNPVSGFNQGLSYISTPGTIESVVQNQVYHGPLPRPNTPPHTPIYVVVTPPGITSKVNDAGGYNFQDQEIDPSLHHVDFADVWCSTFYTNAPSTLSVDAFSLYFSHEIAEIMSDFGGGGFEVKPGATWTGGGSGHQIGDYEGNALSYRLADGALVQPLWSAHIMNWIVSDGNSQNFTVSTTGEWKGSSFQGTYNTLTVTGSQELFNFDDVIMVNSVQIGSSQYLQVTENGQSVQFLAGTVKNLVINDNNMFSDIDIEAAPGNPTITINSTGAGIATITTKAAATINVEAGVEADVNAEATTTIFAGNQTVELSGAGPVFLFGTNQTKVVALQVSGTAFINGAGYVQVGGSAGGPFAGIGGVVGPLAGSTVSINGSAATQVTVLASAGNVVVAGAAAAVNVGQGQITPITGTVAIALAKGSTALTVDDSLDPTEREFVIRASGLSVPALLGLGQLGGLTIFNVTYSAAHLSSLTLKAGSGDVITVGEDNLATLPNLINITGAGTGSLFVDGTGSADSQFVVSSNSVQRYVPTVRPGAARKTSTVHPLTLPIVTTHILTNTINYSNLASVTVQGAPTGSTAFTVVSTTSNTPVSLVGGSAADSFQVGDSAHSLAAIQSTVSVNGNGGADTLTVDDRQTATGLGFSRSIAVTNQQVTWNETIGLRPHQSSITDVFQYTGIPSITIYGNAIGTTFSVQSTAAGSAVAIVAGGGNDSVSVGDNADSLDGIQGPLTLNGGGGANTLTFNDTASTNPESYTVNASQLLRGGLLLGQFSNFQQVTLQTSQGNDSVTVAAVPTAAVTLDGGNGHNTLIGPNISNTWTLTDANTGILDSSITFQNFRNLQGGSGNDTFVMDSAMIKGGVLHSGGGLYGTLDGGGGTNVLDYSAYAANITVDLPLATETGLNQISNVQKIVGSQGNDILVGNGGVTLQGGTGRNLMIAGDTPAKLLGNADDDILVGGTTDYDVNLAALKAILAEWTRTDLTSKSDPTGYQARVNHLLNGGGLNGTDLLNISTFHANVGGNTLTGGAGLDLYYGSKKRDANDWKPALGEQFIEDQAQQNTQIDARSLPFSDMVLDGNDFATAGVETSLLTPGPHTLTAANSTGGITFIVAADGTVDYDPSLDNILSGRGTTTLVIHGAGVTVDATHLSGGALALDGELAISSTALFVFSALPGTYSIVDTDAVGAPLHFTVSAAGTVSYDPSLEGILTGAGTSTLTVHGVTVTIDATHLSLQALDVDNANVPLTSQPFTFAALPGQVVLADPGEGALVRFTIGQDGTVSYDPSLQGILSGSGTNTLVINGVTVTIDATRLSLQTIIVDGAIRPATSAPFTFTGLPGTAYLEDAGGEGATVFFTLNADGTVSYDPSLQGVVTGNGTNTLVVNGVTVTIDATRLSLPTIVVDGAMTPATSAPFTFTGLPGTAFLADPKGEGASVLFTLNADGTVSYNPSLAGVFSGSGTNTLVINGVTVTIDATNLSLPTIDVNGVVNAATTAPFTFTGLPGLGFLADSSGEGASVLFSLGTDGTVSYDPSLQGVFTGQGTSMLVVHGVTLTIDATRLSVQQLSVDNAIFPATSAAFTFTGLPGLASLVDIHGEGTTVTFSLNADGTVSYDPSFQGVLSGSGTNTLVVNGVAVNIDATALSQQTATFSILGAGNYATAQVQALTFLPGAVAFQGGTLQFGFTVSTLDQLDYDASLDSEISGRGSNTLVVLATP